MFMVEIVGMLLLGKVATLAAGTAAGGLQRMRVPLAVPSVESVAVWNVSTQCSSIVRHIGWGSEEEQGGCLI